jgi:hypothetical protein
MLSVYFLHLLLTSGDQIQQPYSATPVTNDHEIFNYLVAGGMGQQEMPGGTNYLITGANIQKEMPGTPTMAHPSPLRASFNGGEMPMAINTNPAFLQQNVMPMSPALSCHSPMEHLNVSSPASPLDAIFFPNNSLTPSLQQSSYSPSLAQGQYSPSLHQSPYSPSLGQFSPSLNQYSPTMHQFAQPYLSPQIQSPNGYYHAAPPGTISPPRSPALINQLGTPGPRPDLGFDDELKRFKCVCGKTFMRKPDLQRHLRNIHAQCWKCGSSWPLPGNSSGLTYKGMNK